MNLGNLDAWRTTPPEDRESPPVDEECKCPCCKAWLWWNQDHVCPAEQEAL
jgi:hypothetical protein